MFAFHYHEILPPGGSFLCGRIKTIFELNDCSDSKKPIR